MTNMEIALKTLETPKDAAQIAALTGIARSTLSHALSQLLRGGYIECAKTETIRGGGRLKVWRATGKPYVPPARGIHTGPKAEPVKKFRRRAGSGVVAPSAYARGYLW